MAGEIKVDPAVMGQIIGEIDTLADIASSYSGLEGSPGRSRGKTAQALAASAASVSSAAVALEGVMRGMAGYLREAARLVQGADEETAAQYVNLGQGSGAALAPKAPPAATAARDATDGPTGGGRHE